MHWAHKEKYISYSAATVAGLKLKTSRKMYIELWTGMETMKSKWIVKPQKWILINQRYN